MLRLYLRPYGVGGGFAVWWENICEYQKQCDNESKWFFEDLIAGSGGKLSPHFWEAQCHEYIEFEHEKDASWFVMRWS